MAGPGVDLVQVVFDRSALAPNEDVAVITMHCRGVQAGLPDTLNPMDDTNRGNFGGKLTTFFNVYKPQMSNLLTVKEYRFYALGAAATDLLGPPDKIIPANIVGGATGPLPPQIALSVTFKTDQRKQWGRFYLPGDNVGMLDTKGRWTAAHCGTIATAVKGLTDRTGSGACLTVWSRSQWTHHDPQTIQVDDIPDVIRSRRFSYPLTRATSPATS